MGIKKVYLCDLCSCEDERLHMRVVLVGTLSHRTEDYGRVLVCGHCAHSSSLLGDAVTFGEKDLFNDEPPADVQQAHAEATAAGAVELPV